MSDAAAETGQKLRVLLVEDSADDVDLLLRELSRNGIDAHWKRVDSAGRFLEALDESEWDVIICDYTMPGFDGLAALSLLRQKGLDIPFIFVSGTLDEETAIEAMRAGAKDYVVKGNLKRLVPAIERELREAIIRHRHRDAEAARRHLEHQLRQAQKMDAVGQLTGGLAHDFNNLLTVITGNLDLIAEKVEDNSVLSQQVGHALDAALRGAELTHRLLAFARRQPLEARVFDFNQQIRDTMGLLRRTLGENIAIELDLAEGLWSVMADRAQMESALTNLALNARDAMPNGGYLTIETSNRQLDDTYAAQHVDLVPGEFVLLSVSDSGRGISQEALPKVFEPFFTTKRKGEGTGLGLSMVYGFVKQSGGHIAIYSEDGQGTTVRIYLPRVDGVSREDADEMHDSSAGTPVDALILLVEDDAEVRRVALGQLESLGYRVLEAADGRAALDHLESGAPIDLLFTDVVMPGGISGPDLAEKAREIRPGLNVLFTSGYAGRTTNNHLATAGAGRLLHKPYRKDSLAQAIHRALEQNSES